MDIYDRALASLQDHGSMRPEHRVLVVCGGDTDARALERRGLQDVLITNLDECRREGTGAFPWQRCDAEDLPFADDRFDWGIVNAGLHHCRSPHRGLLELLRVSRRGALVIEARDSLLMRVAVKLGLTPSYELESVALGTGGLRNGPIPNFIYRWTEREVRKTVESAYPGDVTDLSFFYGLVLPAERMTMCGAGKRFAAGLGGLLARLLFAIDKRQGNQFAVVIVKRGLKKPWIKDGALDREFPLPFDPARYVSECPRPTAKQEPC